jgi:hypothetical protein
MRRPSCEKQPQKTTFSSRNLALMLVNLRVVSLEPKTGSTTQEEHPAVLIIYQNDCEDIETQQRTSIDVNINRFLQLLYGGGTS